MQRSRLQDYTILLKPRSSIHPSRHRGISHVPKKWTLQTTDRRVKHVHQWGEEGVQHPQPWSPAPPPTGLPSSYLGGRDSGCAPMPWLDVLLQWMDHAWSIAPHLLAALHDSKKDWAMYVMRMSHLASSDYTRCQLKQSNRNIWVQTACDVHVNKNGRGDNQVSASMGKLVCCSS